MFRGSTPVHVFQLPFSTTTIRKLRVTYSQLSMDVLEKTEQDVEMEEYAVSLKLTQEETLLFKPGCKVLLQLKVLTDLDTVLPSPVFELNVEDVLNEEVLK